MALPLDRFLNSVYCFATEDAEPKDKNKFDVRLNMPDERARRTGVATSDASPWSKKNEEAALSGFVAAVSGRGVRTA